MTHSQPIRLGTSSVVLTTHSDTQTRRHNQSVYPRHPLYSMYSLFFNDSLTTNPFIHVIRCTYYTTHLDTQTHSQPIRLGTSSVVLTTHSDTQTRRHNQSVYPRHPLYSMYSLFFNDSLTTNPFIHVIRCTTAHSDTQTHSQPIRLSTSSVVLTTHSDTQTRRHADTTNPFRNVIRCTYYTTHLDTQTHSQPIRLGTSSVVLTILPI
jgi:hypothetical protein